MIYRSKRAENFTVLGNGIFADNGLSFEAMGLLAYLLSKPDNWAVHPRLLAKVTEGTAQKRGENKIYALLRELIDAGYITRKRQASGEMHYFVYDEPQGVENKPHPSNPREANPREANPREANPREANPREANPREDSEGVLINTERQQELKLKKNGGGINARAAYATTPPTLSDESASPCPTNGQASGADVGKGAGQDGNASPCSVDAERASCREGGQSADTGDVPLGDNSHSSPRRFEPLPALLALGVDRQVAVDWLAVRKAKLTQTALDGVVREADRAGISVAEAVRICAERGWRGFKADWDWRSGGTPQGRVFDHATGSVVGAGNNAVALAEQQTARAMNGWLGELLAEEEKAAREKGVL